MLPLKKHIGKYVDFTNSDWETIASYFTIVHTKKKEILQKEGQICQYNYYVAEGCIRMYFIDRKGVERTVQFALEHWWLSDYFSFTKKEPSTFFIQSVLKSEIWAISLSKQKELLKKFPLLEHYFHIVHQTAHADCTSSNKFTLTLKECFVV